MSASKAASKQDSGPQPGPGPEVQPEPVPREADRTAAALARTALGGALPLKPGQVLALQRTLGNRATMTMLPPATLRPQLQSRAAGVDAAIAPREPAASHPALEPLAADSVARPDALQRQEALDPTAPHQSQTLNTYSRGRSINWADMCNVTTLAMQLIGLAGDEETAKAGAVELIIRNRGSRTPRQARSQVLGRPAAELAGGGDAEALQQAPLADLIMLRFDQVTNAQWSEMLPRVFPDRNRGGGLFQRQRDLPGEWFQKAIPLAAVGTEILDVIGEATGRTAQPQHLVRPQGVPRQRFYLDTLLPLLGAGKAIMASTGMSGAGHIVSLAEVVAGGVVINDPNGMLFRSNGWWNDRGRLRRRVITNQRNPHHAVLVRRLAFNQELFAELRRLAAAGEATNWPANMGERNFFTWAEVETYRIGNWFNVLGWAGGEAAPGG